jgi:hypothetical protein
MRVPFANLFPSVALVRQAHQDLIEVDNGDSQLTHGVQLAQGHGFLIQGLEVNSDSEGDSYLIGAGIAFSDGLTSVVDLAGDQIALEAEL